MSKDLVVQSSTHTHTHSADKTVHEVKERLLAAKGNSGLDKVTGAVRVRFLHQTESIFAVLLITTTHHIMLLWKPFWICCSLLFNYTIVSAHFPTKKIFTFKYKYSHICGILLSRLDAL